VNASYSAETRILPDDWDAGDEFGCSCGVYGERMIVGSRWAGIHNAEYGAAYIFKRVSGNWIQEAKLTASDKHDGDLFGNSVDIYGNFAVVGAPYATYSGLTNNGAVYIYFWDGDTWIETQKIVPTDVNKDGMWFGFSVAIDGNHLIIGAHGDNPYDETFTNYGSAYIYQLSVDIWVRQAKLTSGSVGLSGFGSRVDIHGNHAIVGGAGNAGYGFVFIYENTTGTWNQTASIHSQLDALDSFGSFVKIYNNTALISAHADDGNGTNSGAVYVYKKIDDIWTSLQKIVPDDNQTGDVFGTGTALNGDKAIIGACYNNDNGAEAGAAYSYLYNGSEWIKKEKCYTADISAGDRFGFAAAIGSDFSIVCAIRADKSGFSNVGSAYIYDNIQDLSLPVCLSLFTADWTENQVVLTWRTESEIGNVGFHIYRAKEDGDYDKITPRMIAGQGSSTTPHNYVYTDRDILPDVQYKYKLRQINSDATYTDYGPIQVITHDDCISKVPESFCLKQNYPNPFNATTMISFDLPTDEHVRLDVFNVRGVLIATLFNQEMTAGYHSAEFTCEEQASGVFFYKIVAGDNIQVGKALLVK